MKCIDIQDEINLLEETKSYLEMAIDDIEDSPYHSHLAGSWQDDLNDMQQRLEELYEMQNEQYDTEMRQLNKEYEENRI